MSKKRRIMLFIMSMIFTILFITAGVFLFKYSMNFADGTNHSAMALAGCVFSFLLSLISLCMVFMSILYDD